LKPSKVADHRRVKRKDSIDMTIIHNTGILLAKYLCSEIIKVSVRKAAKSRQCRAA